MFRFSMEQKTFEIAGVRVGGQPGEVPTLLAGSIFYSKHKIVSDEKKGIFDKDAAEALIRKQEELADKTGNGMMIDIVASTPEAIVSYIDFVTGVHDGPFLIDSAGAGVKIAAAEYAKETGLSKRLVYNSISAETKEDEFIALKENDVEAVVLLTYTNDVMNSSARVGMVDKLMPKLEESGVTNVLVDSFVMDVPSLTPSSRAIVDIKKKTGLPCGTAAHNAISTWKGLKKMLGTEGVRSADLIANMMPVVFGADFMLYGPIEDCEYVFPAAFTLDTTYRYAARMKETIDV